MASIPRTPRPFGAHSRSRPSRGLRAGESGSRAIESPATRPNGLRLPFRRLAGPGVDRVAGTFERESTCSQILIGSGFPDAAIECRSGAPRALGALYANPVGPPVHQAVGALECKTHSTSRLIRFTLVYGRFPRGTWVQGRIWCVDMHTSIFSSPTRLCALHSVGGLCRLVWARFAPI
jgi:hypothetical protein